MFSLIGLPPLAGFFAKWQVFLAAIEAHLFALAVIGVLASAVSAFYYLRIIKVMYFDEPKASLSPRRRSSRSWRYRLLRRDLLLPTVGRLVYAVHARPQPVRAVWPFGDSARRPRGYRLDPASTSRLDQHRGQGGWPSRRSWLCGLAARQTAGRGRRGRPGRRCPAISPPAC